jgi:hypothetical protein
MDIDLRLQSVRKRSCSSTIAEEWLPALVAWSRFSSLWDFVGRASLDETCAGCRSAVRLVIEGASATGILKNN